MQSGGDLGPLLLPPTHLRKAFSESEHPYIRAKGTIDIDEAKTSGDSREGGVYFAQMSNKRKIRTG